MLAAELQLLQLACTIASIYTHLLVCLLVSNVFVHSAKKSIYKPVERYVRFTFVDLCNQSLLNLTMPDIYLSLQTYLKECAYNQLTQQVLISRIHKSPVERSVVSLDSGPGSLRISR